MYFSMPISMSQCSSVQDSPDPRVSEASDYDFCPTPPPVPGCYVPTSPEPLRLFPSSSTTDQVTPCVSWGSLPASMVSQDSELIPAHQKTLSGFWQKEEIPAFDLNCLDDDAVDGSVDEGSRSHIFELSSMGPGLVDDQARFDEARIAGSTAFTDLAVKWESRSQEPLQAGGGLDADQRQLGNVCRGKRERSQLTEEDAIRSAKHRRMDTARVAFSEISAGFIAKCANTESSRRGTKRERPSSVMTEEEAFRSAKHRRKDTAGSTGRKRKKVGKGLRKARKWIVTQLVHAGPVLSSLRGFALGVGWSRR